MRRLIYVPLLHQRADSELVDLIIQTMPDEDRAVYGTKLEKLWDDIEKGRKNLIEDPTKTKVFFESITEKPGWVEKIRGKIQDVEVLEEVFNREEVKNLSGGRKVAELLVFFALRGAEIVQAEDPNAYKEVLDCTKETAKARSEFVQYMHETTEENENDSIGEREGKMLETIYSLIVRYDEGQAKRDDFVARQINKNLKEGEVGILVFGGFHYPILDLLDKDIELSFPSVEAEEFVKKMREAGRAREGFARSLEKMAADEGSEMKG